MIEKKEKIITFSEIENKTDIETIKKMRTATKILDKIKIKEYEEEIKELEHLKKEYKNGNI